MPSFIKFKRDNKNTKNPLHLKNGVFLICTPRKLTFPPMQFNRCDTEVMVTLPKDSYGYFTSKYKTVETEQISSNTQRICLGVINKLLTGQNIWFFCIRIQRQNCYKICNRDKKRLLRQKYKKRDKVFFLK